MRSSTLSALCLPLAARLLAAQSPPAPGMPFQQEGIALPASSTASLLPHSDSKPVSTYRPGFLKSFSIESWGIGSGAVLPGYEFRTNTMSAGPDTEHGLDCPRCIMQPTLLRSRYSLPAFGAELTSKLVGDRLEMFGGYGGVNGWRADNSLIEPGSGSFRRDSSFNDAWLGESWFGIRIPIDSRKRIWLNGVGRYVTNYGYGPKHWKTFGLGVTVFLDR